jgi:outer membrane protein
MTEAARAKMQADITSGGRTLNHDIDDLNAEAQEDEGKAMQSMAGKIGNIIKDYATKNGFAVVLDVTGQSTPVLWAAQSANITAEIVKLYDTAHPVKAAAPAPAAPAKK